MSFQAEDILERLRQNQSSSTQAIDSTAYRIADLLHNNSIDKETFLNVNSNRTRTSDNMFMLNDSYQSNNETKISLYDKLARDFTLFNQV